jgi:hypothetical protein
MTPLPIEHTNAMQNHLAKVSSFGGVGHLFPLLILLKLKVPLLQSHDIPLCSHTVTDGSLF